MKPFYAILYTREDGTTGAVYARNENGDTLFIMEELASAEEAAVKLNNLYPSLKHEVGILMPLRERTTQ